MNPFYVILVRVVMDSVNSVS